MESLDELHEFFEKREVEEKKLKKIALYIETYTESLYDTHDVDIGDEELEFISIRLYKTLLHQVRNMSMQIDKEAENIIDDLLSDFEADEDKKAFGNIIALVGKAGTIEELRHPKITELGQSIAAKQQEKF